VQRTAARRGKAAFA